MKFNSSAFATNKDIRCHFGSSTTSKSDVSSYRYSEGSSLFRRSVLHRIRFGNTLRLKAEFINNSAASSLRTNDLLGSDRRPSSSLSAYPDQWMYHHHHRRLSGTPQAPLPSFVTDDLPYPPRILSQKTLDNIPAALGIDLPNVSTNSLDPTNNRSDLETNEKPSIVQNHAPDCIHAANQSNNHKNDLIKHIRKSTKRKTHSNTNDDLAAAMKIVDIESETSSESIHDRLGTNSRTASGTCSKPVCACQLLWQLERDTDSIDKFKLFFKRDHMNVDWDYVQGCSEV